MLGIKKTGYRENIWNGVGGKVEKGETSEQGIVREAREETTTRPMNFWEVAQLNALHRYKNGSVQHFVHVYLCDEWEGEFEPTKEFSPRWRKREDIPYDRMWEDTKLWLPQVLGGNKVYGEFTYNTDDTLETHQIEIVEELPRL
ncbi:hypothetical protein B7Z28_01950 [Candidatus Saccharibacteria bacterium 32-45-3]|nr:MAG: hypothetical protein B7Z28_01950 [Candidatus Saccharibacteria bacterium 32-45-3]